MKEPKIRFAVAALLVAMSTSACAGSGAAPASSPAPAPAPAPAPSGPSIAELEAIYHARRDSARTRWTEADVRFMTDMIHHHTQALAMAALADTHSEDPQIRTLAARIINAQRDEIAIMQRWLRARDQPVPEVDVHASVMGHGHGAHAMMPGMITPEQYAALERARGTEFDRLFLTLMIQHHQGAVAMVHELFATDGAGQDEAVFKFASDAQVDQSTEVARMERMLSRLPPADGGR